MKIELVQNYVDTQCRLEKIDKELALLEDKLKTPARTLDDIILHMELLKERETLI